MAQAHSPWLRTTRARSSHVSLSVTRKKFPPGDLVSRSAGAHCKAAATSVITPSSFSVCIVVVQPFKQPPAGVAEPALEAAQSSAEGVCGLLVGQAEEELKLDTGPQGGVDFFELLEQSVDNQGQLQPGAAGRKGLRQVVKRDQLGLGPGPGVVNQVSAHRSSGDGEKMVRVLPILLLRSH